MSLNRFFRHEYKADFNMETFPHTQLMVPKQSNFCDCGLYMLQFIEMFLRNPEEVYSDTRVALQ